MHYELKLITDKSVQKLYENRTSLSDLLVRTLQLIASTFIYLFNAVNYKKIEQLLVVHCLELDSLLLVYLFIALNY